MEPFASQRMTERSCIGSGSTDTEDRKQAELEPSVMDRDHPNRAQTYRSPGPAPRPFGNVGTGGLRNSRGGTRTPDPLTRNGHGRVVGIRNLSAWRPGNPDENPETGPNRTRPTVPTPYPAKKSATREV